MPGSTIKVVNDSSSFALCRWTAAALELSFARQAFIFHAKLARDEILKMLPCSFAPIYSTRRTFRSSLSAEHFSWSFEKQNVFQVGPRDLQSRSIGCLPHAQARNRLSFLSPRCLRCLVGYEEGTLQFVFSFLVSLLVARGRVSGSDLIRGREDYPCSPSAAASSAPPPQHARPHPVVIVFIAVVGHLSLRLHRSVSFIRDNLCSNHAIERDSISNHCFSRHGISITFPEEKGRHACNGQINPQQRY